MKAVFKYSFPIYTDLQKIFRIAPQFSGLGPATSSLSWPLLAKGDSPRIEEDLACRPPASQSVCQPLPCCLKQHCPASWVLCIEAKTMSIGWIKIPKPCKIFLPYLTHAEWKWMTTEQSTVTCTALFARQQPQVLILIMLLPRLRPVMSCMVTGLTACPFCPRNTIWK